MRRIKEEPGMNKKRVDLSLKIYPLRKAAINVIKMIYPHFSLRPSDVILGSFPKSGVTWFRFIMANLISISELGGRVVDYHLLNGELRAAYDSHDVPTIEFAVIPRIFATHRKYSDRRFGRYRKIYLYRNPADTMVSYYEFRKAWTGTNKYLKEFKYFIRDDRFGLTTWCQHVQNWRQNSDVVLTYEDLKENTFSTVKRALEKLNICSISDNNLREAISRSSFRSVRRMEEEKGLDIRTGSHLKDGFRFARKGSIGQWQEYFDDNDLVLLRNVLEEYELQDITIPEDPKAFQITLE